MSVVDYREARAQGQKEFRSCISSGRNPYLLVLDTILLFVEIQGEESLGLVDIPINRIVGTKTEGRTNAFAANFLPLLDENSEFAAKWAHLADVHIEEGIRDPVVAYEYMNKFFVAEGNKRVSVMKYFNAASIPGNVRRMIPKPQNTEKSRIYYDFLDFYKLTGVNYIWFSKAGKFTTLLNMLYGGAHVWTSDERVDFSYAYYRFRKIFKAVGGDSLPGTTGDAFLAYLKISGMDKITSAPEAELRENIKKSWSELAVASIPEPIELDLDPGKKTAQPSFLSKILPNKKTDSLKVLYVYENSPESSPWAKAHDEGRQNAEGFFEGKISSRFAADVTPDSFETVVGEEIEKGADVVFTASVGLLPACLKAAVKYPDIKFLNCSVYSSHPIIRSYSGRMYEVKFLAGLIAGAMTRTHKIGYIADNPIYGAPAAINAFASGAKMTDPYAQVILRWRMQNDNDVWEELISCGADMIAGSDADPVRPNGLYRAENGEVSPICSWKMNWGQFYIHILQEILDSPWKNDPDRENPKAVNYWWGLSAGVFDMEYAEDIPADTRQLVSLLRDDIIAGRVAFFNNVEMSPESIIKMDTLSENVEGSFPDISELTDNARELARLQGIYPEYREDRS